MSYHDEKVIDRGGEAVRRLTGDIYLKRKELDKIAEEIADLETTKDNIEAGIDFLSNLKENIALLGMDHASLLAEEYRSDIAIESRAKSLKPLIKKETGNTISSLRSGF